MAVRKIETTISLDGEQAFKSALSSATREMRVMESELRAVSAAYDTNGNSAQFFAAKQQNLRNQIAQQREIVESLERAVKDAGEAYGDSSSQVDAYAIRLNNARTRLSRLEQQLSETDSEMEELGRDAQRAGRQLEDGIGDGADSAKSSLESLYNTMQQDISAIKSSTAVTAITSIWDMATGAYNSVAGFVEGTAEYRKQLSFLELNAATNNFDFSQLKEHLVEVTGLTGDSSAAIEGLSNLLAAGVDERQMEAAIDGLAGAVISFPDTMKFESLADSLQETLATGTATGQFAELLGRLGVDVEGFNKALAESDSAAGDLDIALAYLAAHGMTQVYNQWKETNGAMSDAAQTQAALELELAEFAGTLEQYITTPVKQVALDAMTYINDVVELAKEKGGEVAGKKVVEDFENWTETNRKEQIEEAPKAAVETLFSPKETNEQIVKNNMLMRDAVASGFKKLFTEGFGGEGMKKDAEKAAESSLKWIADLGMLFTKQQEELDNAELYSQQKVMDLMNGDVDLPEISLIKEAGAEGKGAGEEAGKQYGQSFAESYKDFVNNEMPKLPNPLENVSPGQTMIDNLGVGQKWQEQLDSLTTKTQESMPKVKEAGEGMGNALASGLQESTANMSDLFPSQIVVDAENAIPAMGIAGEEAGNTYGQSFADAYKNFVNNEFPQLPNPLEQINPGQAMIDTMGVAEEWTNMLDGVKSAASSTSAAMAEEGAAMGTNYAEGISSTEDEAESAGEGLGAAAENGVSSASGSGAYAVGSNIGSQLAAGLLSQVGYVSGASSRLGAAATSGLGSGGIRTSGLTGGTGGVINAVLNIDGRAFASATSSYISSSLAVRG